MRADSLSGDTTGAYNVADGVDTMLDNTTGSLNLALGDKAGDKLTTGAENVDLAYQGVAGDKDTIRSGQRAPRLPPISPVLWGDRVR